MNKSLVILFINMIILNCSGYKNQSVTTEMKIEKKINEFIDSIISDNQSKVIDMISEKGANVDEDLVFNKKEIKEQFDNRKWLYLRLFDTKNYSKYLLSNGAFNHRAISIKDDLIEIKNKNHKIKFIDFQDSNKTLAYVLLAWDGSDKSEYQYSFYLIQENDDWKISSLIIRNE